MKRIIALICVVVFSLLLCVGVAAGSPHMVDETGTLSAADVSALESKLAEISARQGMDVVILYQEDLEEGKTSTEIADDYYDYNGYADNGILLYVAASGYWAVSTTGSAIGVFTDYSQEVIMDEVQSILHERDFVRAFNTFAVRCDERIDRAAEEVERENQPRSFRWGLNTVITFGIGFLVSLITTGSMKGKLNSVHRQSGAASYVRPDSLDLTDSRELFLYSQVARQPRSTGTSGGARSGGGSTTHVSSSGRTHGGSSGRF